MIKAKHVAHGWAGEEASGNCFLPLTMWIEIDAHWDKVTWMRRETEAQLFTHKYSSILAVCIHRHIYRFSVYVFMYVSEYGSAHNSNNSWIWI